MKIDEQKASALEALKTEVSICRKCKLHKTRTQTVFGEGKASADVMFIGEGPGREEDIQGRPFVGRAGQLLTSIIEKGMKIPRDEVFIANVVKCRPTVDMLFVKDRPPDDDETAACSEYLRRQIDIIKPRVIITLGNPSTKFILNTKLGITKIRGNWGEYKGIHVMPTYHPSFVLRNGGDSSPLKKDVWSDIKKVLQYLDSGNDVKKEVKDISPDHSIKSEAEIKEEQGKLF